MPTKIAIPEPTSRDAEYNQRSLPPYIAALESCGASAVVVPLNECQENVARLLSETQGVLLPGSRFDVDPERYGEKRIADCGPADPERTAVDELLLQDSFNLRKPVLAICQGIQTLNVWLNGSLIQDINAVLHSPVNHSPGREITDAHPIHIAGSSRLAEIASGFDPEKLHMVNSSHHQALGVLGDNLRETAVSPQDGIIEAVELSSMGHFVLGVQWHPERTFATQGLSRGIFARFVQAAAAWKPIPERISESS